MKKVKYGKSTNKIIYVPAKGRLNEIWKNVVDKAYETDIGIGTLLLNAWAEKQNISQ